MPRKKIKQLLLTQWLTANRLWSQISLPELEQGSARWNFNLCKQAVSFTLKIAKEVGSEGFKAGIPRFSGEDANYALWKVRSEAILQSKKLLDIVPGKSAGLFRASEHQALLLRNWRNCAKQLWLNPLGYKEHGKCWSIVLMTGR